jgi:multidrug resistance efflux pump
MSAEPTGRAGTAPPDVGPEAEAEAATEPLGEETPAAPAASPRRRRLTRIAIALVVLAAAAIGYQTWQGRQQVEIEEATLTGPQVPLPARAGGTLKAVYASVGDEVRPHRPIARVGNEVVTSDVPGTVIAVRDDLGATIPPGSTVAWLLNRGRLRAVGRIDEDKGLEDIRIGQRARVEVDAIGGREFEGTVEEVSDRPSRQDIRFSISDKREERQYEVKVAFDGVPDAALRQGMSARIWVER